ncbi:mediator of RNA polymerase II transcription subunit 13 [Teratosphaeriaceae sp. CCFEE 6253]|nr:mediator of RNA polymerase II transcription subunit 13 [Teratosphaeriaceae sp. CCFEE 6253]
MGADDDSVLATSPPFVQRTADQQAALAGIYPTPPDGLIQGQQASQQPSSDNTGAANTQVDPHVFAHDYLPGSDDIPPRQSISSSSNPPAVQHGSDDLFGDMSGEMDFGAGEVGDEDFDFFNEKDAVAAASVELDADMLGTEHGGPNSQRGDNEESMERVVVTATPDLHEEDDELAEGGQGTDNVQHVTVSTPLVVMDHGTGILQKQVHSEPVKPLSPFGIKERLLPPPVPASTCATHQQLEHRRSSTFDPMSFREDLNIGRKFSSQYGSVSYTPHIASSSEVIDISLPPTRKKPRLQRPSDHDSEASESGSESEEDSYESASSVSDDDLPPKTPWSTKNRKRADFEDLALSGELQRMLGGDENQYRTMEGRNKRELQAILGRVLPSISYEGQDPASTQVGAMRDSAPESDQLGSVEDVLHLGNLDLVYTAQLVSKQAVSCMPSVVRELDVLSLGHEAVDATGAAVQLIVDHAIEQTLSNAMRSDIAKLAITRDPPSRTIPAPARPGQPRPPQRSDPGPAIFAVPPPYVRVQRGNDTFEMLPPALDFWETLSLAPTDGQKDIRAYFVCPPNEDLHRSLDAFLSDLGVMYENCKLGSHAHIRNVDEDNELDEYVDGFAMVEMRDDESLEGAIRACAETCTRLGAFLAGVGNQEPERTIVVYVLNPFPDTRATHHLCACFWLLCQAYRDGTPKALRGQPRSDILLQLLPIELVASADGLVVLDAKQSGALAKEVYDRCPPTPEGDYGVISALPNFSAPLFQLASPLPKRIGFQLTAEPPSDLLHELSSLHMAYAISGDGRWLTAAWTDSTARYQSSTSICLCGRTFADVAAEVWGRTREIIAAREVTWRIFIMASGIMEESYRKCWRRLVGQPRKQLFSVTLLSAQLDLDLQLSPPSPSAIEDATTAGAAAPGSAFLTPGSTPQAMTVTVSPDVNGNALPPTPAPSDAAGAFVESDPDAHLIDTADETWAVLLPATTYSAITSPAQTNGLAHGALFKRGSEIPFDGGSSPGCHLPCLGVSLLWTVQVRPNGNVDEGPVKQTEMVLREALKMFRGLSVLTRARGLGGEGGAECWPVHLVNAVRGSEALMRFL